MILSAVFGVVLFGFGFANFAMAEVIPGVDIIVQKKPGGIAIQVKTGADGTYKFTGLAPGTYDLIIPGQPVKLVTVSTDGTLGGVLSREPDGKVSLSISGQAGSASPVGSAVNVQIFLNTNITSRITPPGTAPNPTSPGQLPGIAGTPIQGTPVGLEHDPEGIKASAKTDGNGAFQFTNLRPGKYKVTLPDGQPGRSISVDASGTFAGTVKRGSDGTASIFDRWGTHIKAK